MSKNSFFQELKRRNVYKVAIAYGITAWLLAQVASLAANTFEAPSWVMKIILVSLISGFPIALILAWAYEMTPQGIVRTDILNFDKNEEREIRIRKPIVNNIVISVLVALLIGQFIYIKTIGQNQKTLGSTKLGDSEFTMVSDNLDSEWLGVALPSGPRIAVLPFRNLSNDQEQEYFSDGLTEDIITALSRTDLFVQGFSPSLRSITDKSIVDVGKELRVRYLLNGSVRRDVNNIRVSAQLFDTNTGGQIWGESYSRDLTVSDIFAVQDDITARVAATIADASGIIARKRVEEIRRNPNIELGAYECVLQSYAYEALHTAEAHLEARKCIERSIEMDSTYADLLGIAAYLYREEHHHDFNQRPGALDNAMRLAKRAIEIDPLNQNGHYALAYIYADMGVSRMDDFFKYATRTIELNPNNSRVGGLGVLIAFGGKWEWGINLLEKTLNINPYSHLKGWMHFTKATNHFRLSQYSQAFEEIEQSQFDLPISSIVSIGIHVNLNRRKEAISLLNKAIKSNPEFLKTARVQVEKFFQGADDLHEKFMQALEKAMSWSKEK